jgi:hypothetical protein
VRLILLSRKGPPFCVLDMGLQIIGTALSPALAVLLSGDQHYMESSRVSVRMRRIRIGGGATPALVRMQRVE